MKLNFNIFSFNDVMIWICVIGIFMVLFLIPNQLIYAIILFIIEITFMLFDIKHNNRREMIWTKNK